MADTKKEYTSNLHPKGDMDTTVYPNVKSENIIDKDTTAYNAGKVPDSSLVSKSLDGLNEKIETNKIQTDTNKTNIATLQGDVSSLKQDNETTKTTIAGLVSDNTQNKKDIATLKANTINKDTDASLKSLTLPSASDLKTKDGTSFGGGSKVYNGTEYLPTFDIATLKDTYVDINSDQTIHGAKIFQPLTDNNLKSAIKIYNGNYTDFGRGLYISGISSNGFTESGTLLYKDYASDYSIGLCAVNGKDCSIGLGYGITIRSVNYSNNGAVKIITKSSGGASINAGTNIISFNGNLLNTHPITVSQNNGSSFNYVLLDSDLPHYYRHTVTIYKPSDVCFRFTDYSEKNTVIDSVQDLITVFGNTKISGSGSIVTLETGLMSIYIGIDVGTTIDNTVMINSNDLEQENFTDVFGTTGFTITDEVTPM